MPPLRLIIDRSEPSNYRGAAPEDFDVTAIATLKLAFDDLTEEAQSDSDIKPLGLLDEAIAADGTDWPNETLHCVALYGICGNGVTRAQAVQDWLRLARAALQKLAA